MKSTGWAGIGFSLVAAALGLWAAIRYAQEGYGLPVLATWIASLFLGWLAFRSFDRGSNAQLVRFEPSDWYLAALLVLLFAPIYLAFSYYLPYQISTDEVTIMAVASELTAEPEWDFFSLSNYFSFPSFSYLLLGGLGRVVGGIQLANMRFIHGSFGLITIALSFLFLRTMLSRRLAFAAAVVLGINHSLIAISRMAIKDNSALLVEVTALMLLLVAYRSNRLRLAFAGGAVAGVSFYVYEPSRATIAVWILFLIVTVIMRRSRDSVSRAIRVGYPSLLACLMVAGPIIATSLEQFQYAERFQYQTRQLLWSESGQELQMEWVSASSIAEGIRTNVMQGIAVYNNGVHDNGYIYYNPGHGFVDPLTGVLLWIGVLVVVSRFRNLRDADLLMFSGFLLLWLTFSFVMIKAPKYTQQLLTLPFVAYFVVAGCVWIAESVRSIFNRRGWVPKTYAVDRLAVWLLVGAIAIWNLLIFGDFAVTGLTLGDEVGGVARYVMDRQDDDDYRYVLVVSEDYPFYFEDRAEAWRNWIEFFGQYEQAVDIIGPYFDPESLPSAPLTLLMGRDDWSRSAQALTAEFPNRVTHSIMSDGSFIAVEILEG